MASNMDTRNKNVKCFVDGKIVHRSKATVNVFDSGFNHGKQIWSSPRLVNGKVFKLDQHLKKIFHGIKALHCPVIPTENDFKYAIAKALEANGMRGATGVHIRIVFTPGTQYTSSMNMKAVRDWDGNCVDPTIIVMPEWRGQETVYDTRQGEEAIVSALRRPGKLFADQTIHCNNQIHSSLACDEATAAGVAAAIMLDAEGFVAETHASHIAIVKDGTWYTPFVRCCPPGVTRLVLMDCCAQARVPFEEDDISLARLRDADEVMIMGTMSGPIPCTSIDGAPVGTGEVGPVTRQLQGLYAQELVKEENLHDVFAVEGYEWRYGASWAEEPGARKPIALATWALLGGLLIGYTLAKQQTR